MATNRTVGELSQTSGAGDWTELERRFFAAAPPEVAVQPPPAPSFDDLEPAASGAIGSHRPRRGLARTPQQSRPRLPSVPAAAAPLAPIEAAPVEAAPIEAAPLAPVTEHGRTFLP